MYNLTSQMDGDISPLLFKKKVNSKQSVHYSDNDDDDWLGFGAYATVRKAQWKDQTVRSCPHGMCPHTNHN